VEKIGVETSREGKSPVGRVSPRVRESVTKGKNIEGGDQKRAR